jgi:probable phosphoglycerate mutase
MPEQPEPARICVVRHGETDWNVAGVLQGWLDVPLNDRGREQSRAMADAFAGRGFAHVYASPLRRSFENAAIVAERLGLPPPTALAGLKERNFGDIQGVPKAELAELNPLLIQQILKRNPAASFPEGEAMDEFAGRVLSAIREIGARRGGERVLVITHGWTMDVVTREVSGLPRSAILHHKPRNGECLWLAATRDSILPLPDAEALVQPAPVQGPPYVHPRVRGDAMASPDPRYNGHGGARCPTD